MAVSQSLTLTQAGQSVVNNYSQVRILWKSTQSGASYNANTRTAKYYISINGGAEEEFSVSYTLPKGTTKTILDTTVTVPHTAEGKGTIKVRTWMDTKISAGVITKSSTLELDDIPRASSLSATHGLLGSEISLNIAAAVSSFKHRLTYTCGDVAGYIVGSTTQYYTGDPAIKWTPPVGLAAEYTADTSVFITFTLYTYAQDGTHIGTTSLTLAYGIPTTVKPSCTISVEDTAGLIAKYGAAVQGFSKLKITVDASTSQGAPISWYEISANGIKYNAETATTEALQTVGTNKIAATVKDTRGRTGSNSKNVEVLAYTAPTVSSLTVHRCNEDGTANDDGDYVKAVINAKVSSLNDKNTATYTLRYRKKNDANATEIVLDALTNVYDVVDYAYVFPAEGNYTYSVAVHATDNHDEGIRTTSVSTAYTLMNWGADGRSIAFGKVAEFPGFEVDMPANGQSFKMVGVRNYSLGDAYGHILYNNGLLIQWGAVTITPEAVNAVASAEVIFPIPYKARPFISGTLMANSPQLVTWGMGGGDPQTDGLVIYLNRSTLHSTAFRWMAVGLADPTKLPEVATK